MRNTMQIEANRLRRMLADTVAEREAEGGDLRCFTAALMTAALELYVEGEGPEALGRTVARMAQRERAAAH